MTCRSIWLAGALIWFVASPATANDTAKQRFAVFADQAKATMLSNPTRAAQMAKRGYTLAAEIVDQREKGVAGATALWLEAEAYYRLGDLDSAVPLINRALAHVRQAAPRSNLAGNILLTSGSIHGDHTEVSAALVDLLEAHKLFVATKDARGQAISLVCISTLFKNAKDYPAALRYLQEALDAFNADPMLEISIHINRGNDFSDFGQFEKAEREFETAYRLSSRQKGIPFAAQIWRNRAINYLLMGKISLAEQAISHGLRASVDISEAAIFLPLSAQAKLQGGRPDEARSLIERSFAGIDLNTTTVTYRDAHKTAFLTYRALHESGKALAHLIALKRLDDEATKLATQTSTALMAARFDSANQEAKIARLQDAERLRVAREALQQAEMQRTLLLVLAGMGMAILILLLVNIRTLRRNRDELRAAHDDLDITNAALTQALAVKTEFLASTSHEIRTPLNGILGMTQVMLTDGSLPAPARERLQLVHGAGVTMRGLVDDILDAAKLEKGNLLLETRAFDLCACLRDASAMWAEQARAKGLAFETDLGTCPPLVTGDAGRVRQIVTNLLSNAVKFTASGTVSLQARAVDGGIRIDVSDTGIGIAPDRRAVIFEPFRQADASTTRKFGGTGLGLSICRSLARAMEGDIVLTSRRGEGTTFTVTLPLAVADALPVEEADDVTGPVLLIVERNPIARAMFRSLLAAHVNAVRFASTPDEVAEAIAVGNVAQLLIDDATVRASGDVQEFLRATVAVARPAPVTLLWPVADPSECDELRALGITAIVGKPVSGAALITALFGRQDVSPLVSQAA